MELNKNIFHKIGDIINTNTFKIIVAIISAVILFDIFIDDFQIFHYPDWVKGIVGWILIAFWWLLIVFWLLEKLPMTPAFLLGSLGAFAIMSVVCFRYIPHSSEWSYFEWYIFIFLNFATLVFTVAFIALFKYLGELDDILQKQKKDSLNEK